MGVVRREGDWRLNKQQDGVYEVTYDKQPELKIITSDYNPDGFVDEQNDFSLPVHEVDSYSGAEELFQDMANGGHNSGQFTTDIPSINSEPLDTEVVVEDDSELADLPPVGILLVCLLSGGFSLQRSGINPQSPVFILGTGLLAVALVIVALAYRVYQSEGAKAAIDFLVSLDEESDSTNQNETDSSEKTPPTPENMKDDIYFDRAEQHCEWCEERTDSPEIHHIRSRAEGGPNDYENLIALCPGCHRKADKGGISRSKLRSKVGRQMENWEPRN